MIKSYNLCSTFWHKVLGNCPVPFFGLIVCPSVIHCTFMEHFLSCSPCSLHIKQRQIYLPNLLSLSKFICPIFPTILLELVAVDQIWSCPTLFPPVTPFLAPPAPTQVQSGETSLPIANRGKNSTTLYFTHFFPLSKSQKSEHIVTSKRSIV